MHKVGICLLYSVQHTPFQKFQLSLYLFANIRFLSYNLIIRVFNIPRFHVSLLINETVNCQGRIDSEPSDSKYSVEESGVTNEWYIEDTEKGSGASQNMINFIICIIFINIFILMEVIKVPIPYWRWLWGMKVYCVPKFPRKLLLPFWGRSLEREVAFSPKISTNIVTKSTEWQSRKCFSSKQCMASSRLKNIS